MNLPKYIPPLICGICVSIIAASLGLEPFSAKWWTFCLATHALWIVACKAR